MGTQKTLIGTIPIKQIEQEVSDFMEQIVEDSSVLLDVFNMENDPEGRSEIILDSSNKIISYRKEDGTKVENIGIETKHIDVEDSSLINATVENINIKNGSALFDVFSLTENGMTDFQQALIDSGFDPGSVGDWSNEKTVCIPIPRSCAMINILTDNQAETKTSNIETFIEYWDMDGNYFKKPIILNAQGQSSMMYHIKNQAFDLDDGSSLRFGNWIACDSFHLKKYFVDVFRGQCIVGYWLTEQVYQTRNFGNRRPWSYLFESDSPTIGNGKFNEDFDTGALAHPDGFPVKLFFNGKNAGIYAFNLKKDRNNYYCSKKEAKNIILDGILGINFFYADGDLTKPGADNKMIWQNFEVRNPKSLCYAVAQGDYGYKYDADVAETEIAGNNSVSKEYDDWSSSVTNYAVGKVVKHLNNYFLNTIAGNTNEPVLKNGSDKNTYDSPDFKNKTGCGWINCTMSVNVKYNINKFTTVFPRVEEALTDNDKKSIIESAINIPFFIDYDLISQVTFHFDGYGKNWIWVCNDGEIWAPTLYDMDSIFGSYSNGTKFEGPINFILTSTVPEHPATVIRNLYKDEMDLRYKELRDKKIFDADNIISLLEKWLNQCGYDNLKEDIEEIVTSPYIEDGEIVVDDKGNPVLIPNTPSYRDSEKTYAYQPTTGGWYNGLQRVYNWLKARISYLDSYYNYNI